MSKQELEVYIHIPFCQKKCAYCDFLSFSQYQEDYVTVLKNEIQTAPLEGKETNDYIVKTIFIGGGTPSILKEREIASLLETLYQRFEIDQKPEITIEANPGTLTKEKLKGYFEAGINRISMGLQSANNEELKELGRIHTYEQFLSNYHLARETGFSNINIDLMSAIPNQTIESFRRTLQTVIKLNPEHISAYSLIVEEGTRFYERLERNELELPDEEEERQMYYDTKRILAEAGYDRYEISNYSKKGYECRHNIGYWKRTDYIGFGLGASSLIHGKRFTNETDMEKYLETARNGGRSLHQNIQKLALKEAMEEFMFLGLRLTKGVSKEDFQTQFGIEYEAIYKTCSDRLVKQGLLEIKGEQIFLTQRGLDLSNQIMAEFLILE